MKRKLKVQTSKGFFAAAPRLAVETGVLRYHKVPVHRIAREFRVIMHKDKSLSGPVKPFLELLQAKLN